MNSVWQKISPVTFVLLSGIEDPSEYWVSVETIMNSLTPHRDIPSPTADFPAFVERLFQLRAKLDPNNPEDVVAYLVSSTKIEDARFLIWQFSDCLVTPYLFVNAMNMLLNTRTPVRGRIAQFPGSLDFIFDHYIPLLETLPIEKGNDAVVARIDLFQLLCKLLTDFPDKIFKFGHFQSLLWNRLLRLMRNSSATVSIASFRTATQFFKQTMDKLDPQTQAAWMLKLVQTNPAPSLLHHPSIRFAMSVRPSEFGFVTLCKTLIEQGITDQCDIGMMSRVLRLPVVKNPTDVLQYFFKMATNDKLLGNAARRAIQRPLLKFKDLQPFRPWGLLYTKRCFQFVVFANTKGKYIRRIYLILHFYAMVLSLEIEWLTKVITMCASTIVNMGKCEELFNGRFPLGRDSDAKMREELEKTPLERLNLKTMLNDVKVNIQLIDDGDGSSRSSGRASGRKGKPTIAEVKARFLAARNAGKQVQSTDLALLEDEALDDGSPRPIEDDGLDQ
jgi:hypothetical protein